MLIECSYYVHIERDNIEQNAKIPFLCNRNGQSEKDIINPISKFYDTTNSDHVRRK